MADNGPPFFCFMLLARISFWTRVFPRQDCRAPMIDMVRRTQYLPPYNAKPACIFCVPATCLRSTTLRSMEVFGSDQRCEPDRKWRRTYQRNGENPRDVA